MWRNQMHLHKGGGESCGKVNCKGECWVRTWLFLILGHRQWGLSPGFPPVFGECYVKMSPLLFVLCGSDLLWIARMQELHCAKEQHCGKWIMFRFMQWKVQTLLHRSLHTGPVGGKNDVSVTERHVPTIFSFSYYLYCCLNKVSERTGPIPVRHSSCSTNADTTKTTGVTFHSRAFDNKKKGEQTILQTMGIIIGIILQNL